MTARILAVDDSRTMRTMLQLALSEAGFDVELAEDGIDGIEKLKRRVPDLVITDINMPRLDGFGVIERIRADPYHCGLPVLVLTTEDGQAMKQRARDSGATGWIVKPFDADKLVAAIHRLLV